MNVKSITNDPSASAMDDGKTGGHPWQGGWQSRLPRRNRLGPPAFAVGLAVERFLDALFHRDRFVGVFLIAQNLGVHAQEGVHGFVAGLREIADLNGAAVVLFGF